jgi:hypothetical protein
MRDRGVGGATHGSKGSPRALKAREGRSNRTTAVTWGDARRGNAEDARRSDKEGAARSTSLGVTGSGPPPPSLSNNFWLRRSGAASHTSSFFTHMAESRVNHPIHPL